MSLQIGDAVSSGFEKLLTTAGLQLAALSVLITLVSTFGINSVVAAVNPEAAPALALPVGTAVGAVMFLLGMVGNLVLNLVLLRTMAHHVSELDSIPGDVTRSLVKSAAFLLVANLVVGVAVFVGTLLLIIPGIFLFVSLAFAQVYVAVEDEGPIEALSSSWSLASGNRLSIFLLFLVLVGIGIAVSLVGTIPSLVMPAVGSLLSTVLTAILSVFSTAVVVDAYYQLSGDREGTGGEEDLTASPTV